MQASEIVVGFLRILVVILGVGPVVAHLRTILLIDIVVRFVVIFNFVTVVVVVIVVVMLVFGLVVVVVLGLGSDTISMQPEGVFRTWINFQLPSLGVLKVSNFRVQGWV